MAKKSKKKEQSRFVDWLVAFVMTLIMGYFLFVTYLAFTTGKPFMDVLLGFKGVYEFFLTINQVNQLLIGSLIVAMSIFFWSLSNNKTKGYKNASDHGAYGNSSFSDIEELREDGFIASGKESKWSEKNPFVALGASEGIILGRDGDDLVVIPPDSKLDNRNVLVVGSSGSSKGQAFVINNIINHRKQTIVVTDPKGELFELTSEIKRDQGYRVHQIDFLNLKGSRYNPLDYVTNDIEAVKIANAISINSAKDVKQDFFFNTARDLLTGLIIYCINEFDKPNISRTVKGIFNQISNDEDFLPSLCDDIGENHPAYQYLKDASASTGNTRTSILSSFAQQTGVFSLSDVGKLTDASDFDFNELQEHKTILYVKIPVKDNPVPALTATFFDQLISLLYQIGDHNGSILPIPTIFLLDEFANLGKLHDYDNTLSTCRGYNLSMMTIVQDFAQLEGKYSKEITRTIINNHDTTLFLKTKDTETAKYFERIAGETTIRFETKSSSNSGGWMYILGLSKNSNASRSTSEQYIKKPLISESELISMKGAVCYVFMAGHKVELEKAYQSLIYKGFLTGTKKEIVKNVERFPYVYPSNRQRYINEFKLEPFADEVAMTTVESIKSTSNVMVVDEQKPSEPIQEKPVDPEAARNLALQSLVSNFFTELENKKVTDVVTSESDDPIEEETEEKPKSTKPNGTGGVTSNIPTDVELAKNVITEIEDALPLTSDPTTLNILQQVSIILPNKMEESNQLLKTIEENQALSRAFDIKTEEKHQEKKDDDLMGELPLG